MFYSQSLLKTAVKCYISKTVWTNKSDSLMYESWKFDAYFVIFTAKVCLKLKTKYIFGISAKKLRRIYRNIIEKIKYYFSWNFDLINELANEVFIFQYSSIDST